MKRLFVAFLVVVCAASFAGCKKGTQPPMGTHKYNIMHRGAVIGSMEMTNKSSGDKYIVLHKLEMSSGKDGKGKTINQEEIVETKDFTPVSFLFKNTEIVGNQKQEHTITAQFKDGKVEIETNGKKNTVDFPKGVLFTLTTKSVCEFLKKKYEPGTTMKYNMIAAPGDKPEETEFEVIGPEEITINGKKRILNHITITSPSHTQTCYCDDRGVLYWIEIKTSNSIITLIKK